MLQRRHPNFSIVEEASDSDDEYQPTVLDESTSSESEGEEQLSIARKHPSKGRAPLQQNLAQLTRSPAGSSDMPNPGCTPLTTSNKPAGHKRSSTVFNSQPRQLPSTSLGSSSSLNVNPRPQPTPLTNHSAFVNPRRTPPNSAGLHHTETCSSNSSHKSFPLHPHYSASSLSSPVVLSAPVFPRKTPSPPASSDNLSSSDIPRHTPPPASPDCTILSTEPRHTPSPAARQNSVSSSVNTLHTPSPPGNSAHTPPRHLAPVLSSAGHHIQTPSISAEIVDWQEEYCQLQVKYNALKEKVRILEQSSLGGKKCNN